MTIAQGRALLAQAKDRVRARRANEVNSLKAISLLNYLSWVLSRDPINEES